MLSGAVISNAQNDKKAEDILHGVSEKYKSYNTIKAEFTYQIEQTANKSKEIQKGVLYLKGPKYKLEIAGQEIISDGKIVWTYMKDVNEVQINEPDPTDNSISPTNIFTMYEKGFAYKFIEEKVENGKTVQIIELTPTDKNKNYFKIRLTVNKADKMIISTRIFDKNGNRYVYSIDKFSSNIPLADSMFIFNRANHPGIEVVDLRVSADQ